MSLSPPPAVTTALLRDSPCSVKSSASSARTPSLAGLHAQVLHFLVANPSLPLVESQARVGVTLVAGSALFASLLGNKCVRYDAADDTLRYTHPLRVTCEADLLRLLNDDDDDDDAEDAKGENSSSKRATKEGVHVAEILKQSCVGAATDVILALVGSGKVSAVNHVGVETDATTLETTREAYERALRVVVLLAVPFAVTIPSLREAFEGVAREAVNGRTFSASCHSACAGRPSVGLGFVEYRCKGTPHGTAAAGARTIVVTTPSHTIARAIKRCAANTLGANKVVLFPEGIDNIDPFSARGKEIVMEGRIDSLFHSWKAIDVRFNDLMAACDSFEKAADGSTSSASVRLRQRLLRTLDVNLRRQTLFPAREAPCAVTADVAALFQRSFHDVPDSHEKVIQELLRAGLTPIRVAPPPVYFAPPKAKRKARRIVKRANVHMEAPPRVASSEETAFAPALSATDSSDMERASKKRLTAVVECTSMASRTAKRGRLLAGGPALTTLGSLPEAAASSNAFRASPFKPWAPPHVLAACKVKP